MFTPGQPALLGYGWLALPMIPATTSALGVPTGDQSWTLFLNAQNFRLVDSDIFVDIKKLSGVEKRGLDIDFLSTSFTYTTDEMRLDDVELETPGSMIEADISFDISKGFKDFENSVGRGSRCARLPGRVQRAFEPCWLGVLSTHMVG